MDERDFWSRVNKGSLEGDCWLWMGGHTQTGYGIVSASPNTWRIAHRLAWELTFGEIPKGLFVCHKCDNPPCVRPDHLFLGTANDNMQDKIVKGRARYPGNPGYHCSEETRRKMSLSHLGKHHSEETRKKISLTKRRNETLL